MNFLRQIEDLLPCQYCARPFINWCPRDLYQVYQKKGCNNLTCKENKKKSVIQFHATYFTKMNPEKKICSCFFGEAIVIIIATANLEHTIKNREHYSTCNFRDKWSMSKKLARQAKNPVLAITRRVFCCGNKLAKKDFCNLP